MTRTKLASNFSSTTLDARRQLSNIWRTRSGSLAGQTCRIATERHIFPLWRSSMWITLLNALHPLPREKGWLNLTWESGRKNWPRAPLPAPSPTPPFWGPTCHRKQRTALSLQMVKQPALASWTRRLSSLTATRSLHFISCKTPSTAGPLFYVPRRKKNTDNWAMQRFLYHFELCTTYRRRWFLLDICVCDISLFCI